MKQKAFTLIELLVVIAIVGILSSVIYSNITGLRDRARVTAGIRFDSSILHSIGDQLVGEWTFDLPTNLLADTSGMGNNGSTTTSPVYYSTGGYNNKGTFYFDGTDDVIKLGTSNVLAMETNDFTATAWINPNALSAIWQGIIGGENGAFSVGIGNNILAVTKVGVSDAPISNFNITNNLNKWTFVTVTFDSHSSANNLTYYINGVLNKKVTYNYNFDAGKKSYWIGLRGGSGGYFSGYIDDVRIYTSTLSGSDIQKLYTEGKDSHNLANK
ncbi:MAG: LamG-like jellyroll fold domain-containing protein [Candidatus Paceibacterota bacterium]|jgi:prepilin-type N-terminal cleavage/methylation domain-containing protein